MVQIFAKQDDRLESETEGMHHKESNEAGKTSTKIRRVRRADWAGEKSDDRIQDLRNSFTLWHLEREVGESEQRERALAERARRESTRLRAST